MHMLPLIIQPDILDRRGFVPGEIDKHFSTDPTFAVLEIDGYKVTPKTGEWFGKILLDPVL